MRPAVAFVMVLLWFSTAARAGDVNVDVHTDDGHPVADAVVTIVPASEIGAAAKFSWPMKVVQHKLAFDPFVLIVPVGAQVAFPNFDSVSHHVFSFSPAKKFEIELYGRDETRSVAFPTSGIVALGCNIHDNMSAFIYVTDHPFAAKTDAEGKATVTGVPAGTATADIWHPRSTAPGQRVAQSLVVSPGTTTLTRELELRAQRRVRHGSY